MVDALGVKSPFSCSTCWRWARSTFLRLHTFIVGIFVIIRCYASSLGCRWAHLSSFSAMRHRWVVTGPYSSLLGLLVSSNLAHTCCHQYFSVPHRFLQEWPDSTRMAPESAGMAPESTGMTGIRRNGTGMAQFLWNSIGIHHKKLTGSAKLT